MRRLLRAFGLAEYGGDEIFIASLACGALASAFYLYLTPYAAPLAFLPWLVIVWFFRDPDRRLPDSEEALVAPADGRVLDIEEVDAPSYMGGRALRVGIFLSPLDVHVNRTPCGGVVEHVRYQAGEFLPAYNPKAPERNESVELGMVTEDGLKVLVKQITGVLARRIVCAVHVGAHLGRGARYGMIKFGSRTEVYVPISSGYRPVLSVGARVRGGETVLLSRETSEPAGEGA